MNRCVVARSGYETSVSGRVVAVFAVLAAVLLAVSGLASSAEAQGALQSAEQFAALEKRVEAVLLERVSVWARGDADVAARESAQMAEQYVDQVIHMGRVVAGAAKAAATGAFGVRWLAAEDAKLGARFVAKQARWVGVMAQAAKDAAARAQTQAASEWEVRASIAAWQANHMVEQAAELAKQAVEHAAKRRQ